MLKQVIWDAIVPIITTLQFGSFQCIRKNKLLCFFLLQFLWIYDCAIENKFASV